MDSQEVRWSLCSKKRRKTKNNTRRKENKAQSEVRKKEAFRAFKCFASCWLLAEKRRRPKDRIGQKNRLTEEPAESFL